MAEFRDFFVNINIKLFLIQLLSPDPKRTKGLAFLIEKATRKCKIRPDNFCNGVEGGLVSILTLMRIYSLGVPAMISVIEV